MDAQQRDDWQKKLTEKVREDPSFLEALQDNPREAMQTALGVEIPKDLALNLKRKKISENDELSDSDLALAVGGQGAGGLSSTKPVEITPDGEGGILIYIIYIGK